MGFFSKIFGLGTDTEKIREYLANGATIIDVRTKDEYRSGHIRKSENIPLQNMSNRIGKIKGKNKKVIACCRSGARSGSAVTLLKRHGIDAVNGGSWNNLESIIKG